MAFKREDVLYETGEWALFLLQMVGTITATFGVGALMVHLCVSYISWLWS